VAFRRFLAEAQVEHAVDVERRTGDPLGHSERFRIDQLVPDEFAVRLFESQDVAVHHADVDQAAADTQAPGTGDGKAGDHELEAGAGGCARLSLTCPEHFAGSDIERVDAGAGGEE